MAGRRQQHTPGGSFDKLFGRRNRFLQCTGRWPTSTQPPARRPTVCSPPLPRGTVMHVARVACTSRASPGIPGHRDRSRSRTNHPRGVANVSKRETSHPKSFGNNNISASRAMFRAGNVRNRPVSVSHASCAAALPGGDDVSDEHQSTPALNMAPEGSEETPNHHPSHSKQKQLLAALNESTKFLVSGAALLTLVTHPNVAMVWCLIGSVVNSCFGKVLKKLLNEKRPAGAAKKDPGMPSSHAVSLSYLSGAYSLFYRSW